MMYDIYLNAIMSLLNKLQKKDIDKIYSICKFILGLFILTYFRDNNLPSTIILYNIIKLLDNFFIEIIN